MITVALCTFSILILLSVGIAAPQFPVMYPIVPMFMPPPPPPMPMGVPMPLPIPVPTGNNICGPIVTQCHPPSKFTNQKISQTKSPNCSCQLVHPFPPMAPMGPVIIMPFQPQASFKKKSSDETNSSDSDDSSITVSSNEEDSDDSKRKSKKKYRREKKKLRRKYKGYGVYRRSGRRFQGNIRDHELQPVLSYISENGDVRFRRRVGKQDAALLLQRGMYGGNFSDKSRLRITPRSPEPPSLAYKRGASK